MINTRPRFAMVRNVPYEKYAYSGRPNVEHALYDIVDNGDGSERVLAYGVRHDPACEIIGALNVQEELARLHACRQEVPII